MSEPPVLTTPPVPPAPKSGMPVWVWIVVPVVMCCPILAAVLFPVFSQARLAAKRTQSLAHIKQIGLASAMYAAENDDRFPKAEAWEEVLRDSTDEDIFKDPQADANSGLGFAMNSAASLAKIEWVDDPQNTVLFFSSSKPGPSANGGAEMLRLSNNYTTISLVDTSARIRKKDQLSELIWTIKRPAK